MLVSDVTALELPSILQCYALARKVAADRMYGVYVKPPSGWSFDDEECTTRWLCSPRGERLRYSDVAHLDVRQCFGMN